MTRPSARPPHPPLRRPNAGRPLPRLRAGFPTPRLLAPLALLLAACTAKSPRHPTHESADSPSPTSDTSPDSADSTAPPAPPAGLTVLQGATVLLPTGGIPSDVWLDGPAIYAVTLDDPPADAVIVDVTGEFITPGLVDGHVHLAHSGATVWTGDPLERNLRANLYHGVLSVLDLGGPEAIFAIRDGVEAGTLLGPHVHATGPFLTAVGSHPCEDAPSVDLCTFVSAVGDDADGVQPAGEAADERIADGADALKVALADADFTPWPTPRLDLDALADITAAADRVGIPTVAHLDENADVIDAIGAGVDVLAHPVFAGPMSDEALSMVTGVPVETTVSAFAAVGDVLDGTTDLGEGGLIVGPGVLENWQYLKLHPDEFVDGWVDGSAEWAAAAAGNLPLLQSAGAVVIPGSDAGYYFVPHGTGLHRELEGLVAAGWTPLEALTAATQTASDILGFPGGTVESGRPADLLILRSDPTVDVNALDDIDRIVIAGVVYDREDLRTVPLVARAACASEGCLPGPGAPACLVDADCPSGDACDGLEHTCGPACDTPYAYADQCGTDAYCIAVDALSDPEGVCHAPPGLTDAGDCDLYAQDCTPAAYGQACVPLDGDTNGCWDAGPRTAGQTCSWDDAELECGVGLYCSLLDYRCYTLCDPDGPDTCPGSQRCVQQESAPGVPWFGVCG